MIKMRLDLGDLTDLIQSKRDKQRFTRALVGIAESARDAWARAAMHGLNVSRAAYLAGLQQPEVEGPGVVSIELKGALANKIERGARPFDLREGLLSGPNARIAKDGHRYAIVPFRHQTPGTRGALATPMDQTYAPPSAGSRSGRIGIAGHVELGERAYKRAQRLRAGQPPTIDAPKLQAHHAVHAFERMYKAGGKGHRYYITFRTVSDRVQKFQHPGFEARNFVQYAVDHASRVAPAALRQLAEEL